VCVCRPVMPTTMSFIRGDSLRRLEIIRRGLSEFGAPESQPR
jgi:hypothetical protein